MFYCCAGPINRSNNLNDPIKIYSRVLNELRLFVITNYQIFPTIMALTLESWERLPTHVPQS